MRDAVRAVAAEAARLSDEGPARITPEQHTTWRSERALHRKYTRLAAAAAHRADALVTQWLVDYDVPEGHDIDLLGDGAVKPAAECAHARGPRPGGA